MNFSNALKEWGRRASPYKRLDPAKPIAVLRRMSWPKDRIGVAEATPEQEFPSMREFRLQDGKVFCGVARLTFTDMVRDDWEVVPFPFGRSDLYRFDNDENLRPNTSWAYNPGVGWTGLGN